MSFFFEHVHIKTLEPRAVADWFVAAFGLKIEADQERPSGDRLIACSAPDTATRIVFSDPRPDEVHADAASGPHFGVEHICFRTKDIEADFARLVELGATKLEEPRRLSSGVVIAFLQAPGDVRVELVQRPPA